MTVLVVRKQDWARLLRWYHSQLAMEVEDEVQLLSQTPANLIRLTERVDRIRSVKRVLEPNPLWQIPVRVQGTPGSVAGTEVVLDTQRVETSGVKVDWVD